MPPYAKVYFVEGVNAGKSFEISPPGAFIGRETDNDIILTCQEASRYHAKIELTDDDSWEIRDLNSSNGTKVNGVKISPTKKLVSGDIISFGTDILKFESSAPLSSSISNAQKNADKKQQHIDGKLESYARARVEQEMQLLVQKLKEEKNRNLRQISILIMVFANLAIISVFILYKTKSKFLKYIIDMSIDFLQQLSQALEIVK